MSDIVVHSRTIAMVAVDQLQGYDKNARTHSDEATRILAGIIRDSGFTNPLLIDPAGVIIAGHGRLMAALELGMLEVPCITISGLTDEQVRALRISDNKVALLSGWDATLLSAELKGLQATGFSMGLTGFGTAELTGLFTAHQHRGADPDEAPAAPKIPVSQLGDLWRLSDHWIICGSSTDAATVEKVLGGAKPHLMVTDPPYGVNYDANWRNETKDAARSARAVGKVLNDDRADWREAWALFPGVTAYVWCASLQSPVVAASLQATGFQLRSLIIWNKDNIAVGRGDFHWKHEPCWYAVRAGVKGGGHWQGSRKENTVWDIAKPRASETGHSTQKPVECMRKPIENNSAAGDHVYDPFSGSGTTIIAGQLTGRPVHAVELNPAYVDVAVLRWEKFTGQAAELVETGESYTQVAERRAVEKPAP